MSFWQLTVSLLYENIKTRHKFVTGLILMVNMVLKILGV